MAEFAPQLTKDEWVSVSEALTLCAVTVERQENERTGGRGFASGGKAAAHQRWLAIRDKITGTPGY